MPTNEYYDSSGFPQFRAGFSSAALKNEFDNIEAGFIKLPALSGNGGKVVKVNSGGSVLETQTVLDCFSGAELASNKDISGGYAGLTLFKINFKNVLNTFTSFFTNSNTEARTYTFQDRDGTIVDDTDLGLKANIDSPTFTGTPLLASNPSQGDNSTRMATTAFVDEHIDSASLANEGSVELSNGLWFRWGAGLTVYISEVFLYQAHIDVGGNMCFLAITDTSGGTTKKVVRLITKTSSDFTVMTSTPVSFKWFALTL